MLVLLLLVVSALGHPAKDELMFDVGDDTAVVESTVREARAAVPEHIDDILQPGVKEAFLHVYGKNEDDDSDVQGYHKKSQDKGSDGYKHFDSYHKKDGDKFGYETHSEYGKSNKADLGSGGKAQKHSETYDDDGNVENDDEAETKAHYKVAEQVDEDTKDLVKSLDDYNGEYYADSGSHLEGDSDAESENDEAESDDDKAEYDEGFNYSEYDEDVETDAEYDEGDADHESEDYDD